MKKLSIIIITMLMACGEDPAPLVIPTVTTEDVGLVHDADAHATGDIESDGGSPITQHGFVWSTSPSPTVPSSNSTTQGAPTSGGSGLFFGNATGLTSKTKYYLRAYATNSVGTGYGTEIAFTTAAKPAKLVVTSQTATTTSYDRPAIIFIVKNEGEKTGYNVKVAINAMQGSTIVDNASAFPANLGDILAGQSAQDVAVFFNLTPAQVSSLTFSTPVVTWLDK